MVVDPTGLDDMVLTRKGLECVLNFLPPLSGRLPSELWMSILDLIFVQSIAVEAPDIIWPLGPRGDPTIPPKDGTSPFHELPPELLRRVLAGSMPAKERTIKCLCGEAREKEVGQHLRPNRVSDLMTVCRKFKESVKEVVYAERFFEIHVHQGGTGGVELLDAGTQPLAYMESGSDDRFAKFTAEDEYGLKSMKKIEISIFPNVTTKRSKAVMLNTYFMIQAICRLLERGGKESDRIVNIKITFPRSENASHGASRRSIMNDEHFWWDPDTNTPRCTSIHNLPDIELALHAFAMLTRVHNVQIDLPASVRNHQPTVLFVNRLISGMTSRSSLPDLLLTAEQGIMIQSMRQETEDFIFSERFGRSSQHVEKLGEDVIEQHDEDGDEEAEDDEDEDGFSKSALARARGMSLGLTVKTGGKRNRTVRGMSSLRSTESRQHQEKRYQWQSFGQREGNVLGGASQTDAVPLTGLLHQARRRQTAMSAQGTLGGIPLGYASSALQAGNGTGTLGSTLFPRPARPRFIKPSPSQIIDLKMESAVAPDSSETARRNILERAQADRDQMQLDLQLNGDDEQDRVWKGLRSSSSSSQDMTDI
ncbi:hypothetical protein Slin14017_G024990 [Septoria linicola]|nr:hypothetical protein Slin14017_G024990 [Septoria linicola]